MSSLFIITFLLDVLLNAEPVVCSGPSARRRPMSRLSFRQWCDYLFLDLVKNFFRSYVRVFHQSYRTASSQLHLQPSQSCFHLIKRV